VPAEKKVENKRCGYSSAQPEVSLAAGLPISPNPVEPIRSALELEALCLVIGSSELQPAALEAPKEACVVTPHITQTFRPAGIPALERKARGFASLESGPISAVYTGALGCACSHF
jgi:hypothetical protein